LIVLLTGKTNPLVKALLVGATHECNESIDDGIHVLDLISLQIGQAGWDGLILRFPSDALEVSDGTAELFARCAGCQDGCVIEFTHVFVNFLDLGFDLPG
jgi:hypothetical protein